MKRALGSTSALVVLICGAGCVSLSTNVASPTAIERQLLGAYEELDRDLVMAASVRGDVRGTPGSWESLRALAIEGRALMRFNQDDVAELKGAGCLAEAMDGGVVARPCAASLGDVSARVARVVEQENRARRAVVAFAALAAAREGGRTVVSPGEIEELRKAYHRLMRQAAGPTDLFETAPGEFSSVAR